MVQIPTTPGQFDPPTPPSIEPSGTEPNYTRSVWHVEEYRHTQVRCTPHESNLVVQRPTTLGEFDMWQNADVPRSDVTTLLIKPSGTELYYTRSVWPTRPPSIEPSGTEPYYTRFVWLPLVPHLNLVVQSPTTPGQFDPLPLPQLNLVVQIPTTPGQFNPSPPLIKPSGTEPYYTRSVWSTPPPSIEPSGTEPYYTRFVWLPPVPHLNLVVQSPTAPCQFDPLPSLNWT